ncbi:MAG: ABC transporter ATP-binding protein [Bacteroidia bacterium]|nr:ABC transporter ATP-binding protein [Bacteroidota bacterium]
MITVNHLTYTYPGNTQPTIKGVNFSLGKGEILGFLGPSGAGKSTTQKILIKLLPGFSGEISIMGKSLNHWDETYYQHIGVGFELPNHYQKLTALENLRFFASFYPKAKRNLMEFLAMVGLEDAANKRVEDFSKGMQMRLNFIRALIHDPEIIFLDEPTSGLDPVNARIMKDIIRDLKMKGKTIFLTTHNMHDAEELCDRVAFMIDGEIRLIDQPKALKHTYGSRTVTVEYQNGNLNQEEFQLDGLIKNQGFVDILSKYKLESIHSKEASLEDIFIQTTGRQLQ